MAIPPTVWMIAAGALALALAWVAFRLARGRGDLVVVIDYQAPRSGVFDVRLARRRERRARSEAAAPADAPASSRFARNGIARETHFRGLPPRTYFVRLDAGEASRRSKLVLIR